MGHPDVVKDPTYETRWTRGGQANNGYSDNTVEAIWATRPCNVVNIGPKFEYPNQANEQAL